MSRFVNPVPQFYLNNGDIASAGKLYFYETGTTTKKDTFSDFSQSIGNTNPVILSGEGRCPNIFGEGRYTVVFKDSDDIEQWSRDDVELSVEVGQYADWSPILTYRVNDIVRGSDGEYYRSITSTNSGNDPTTSAANWEQIAFLSLWNTNVSYSIDDLVILSGILYRALTANSASDPRDNPSDWAADTQPNFSPYNDEYTYSQDQVVFYSGEYYRSITGSNKDNQPDASPSQWEKVSFITTWNTSQTYNEDDIVNHEGVLYRSLVDSNNGNGPDISPSDWAELSLSESSVRVALGNDFIAGQEVVISRLGDTVTISGAESVFLEHASSAFPQSASVVPVAFRPSSFMENTYSTTSDGMFTISVSPTGTIDFAYYDFSGASSARTDTGVNPSISYVIADNIT